MGVLAVHVVVNNDDLQHVRVHRFTVRSCQQTFRLRNGMQRRRDSQSLAVLIGFHRHVERDPAVRLLNSQYADVLQVAIAGPCANGDCRGRVRVVEREAQVH